jgi:hypothetical protein
VGGHRIEAGAYPFLLITAASEGRPRSDHIPHRDGDVVEHGAQLALAGEPAELDVAVRLLFACCSAVIRGATPVGRSSGRNQFIRRNIFRIRCSMASSSQSYGNAPSTRTAPRARSGFRLAQCPVLLVVAAAAVFLLIGPRGASAAGQATPAPAMPSEPATATASAAVAPTTAGAGGGAGGG